MALLLICLGRVDAWLVTGCRYQWHTMHTLWATTYQQVAPDTLLATGRACCVVCRFQNRPTSALQRRNHGPASELPPRRGLLRARPAVHLQG